MKISVIIPNYNGKLLLQKNLPSVIKESGNSEIIVADDASSDGSADFIKTYFPDIKLIEKRKNSGFASTVNLGVKKASGDLIVLLNSDIVPKKNYLTPLLKYFKNPDVFAVGMLHKSTEDGKMVLRGRGLADFKRGFLIHRRGEIDKKDTFWVNGGAGMFKRSIWMLLGGMREIYDPFYWEDIDLSYRAVQKGYRIFFEPDSQVIHIQNKGAIRTGYTKSQINKIAYRNQFLFVWLNLGDSKHLFEHILWLPYHFIRIREKEFYTGFFQALTKLAFDRFSSGK